MLEQITTVLFDLDGTLVDSMWMWKEIDLEYLGGLNLPVPEELSHQIEGMSFSETAIYFKETFHLTESLEEIKAMWISMAMEKYSHQVRFKPGAQSFLRELKKRGIKTGICTSNGRELLHAVMDSLDIAPYMDCVMTACEVPAGKPAPDIYLAVAKKLGADPSQCLVFEDVPRGIEAGLSAGMTVCAVEDAYSLDQREVIRSLAHYYIQSYDQVLNGTYEQLQKKGINQAL
ncbi:MAG: HAD family phosphatase [Lachnospiraceae bacterium]|nr:HAD family phosphatase [Lachnospiraceae bacterium]